MRKFVLLLLALALLVPALGTAALMRSAVRRASSKEWKRQDPQLPKSIWYLTDAKFLGFRIIRPLKVATPEHLEQYWNLGKMPEN